MTDYRMPASSGSHGHIPPNNPHHRKAWTETDPVVRRENSRVLVACHRCRKHKRKCSQDRADGTPCAPCVAANVGPRCEFNRVGARTLQLSSPPNTLGIKPDAVFPPPTLEPSSPVDPYGGGRRPFYDQAPGPWASTTVSLTARLEISMLRQFQDQRPSNTTLLGDSHTFTNAGRGSLAPSAGSMPLNPTIPQPPPRSRAPILPHPRYSPPATRSDGSTQASATDSAIDPRILESDDTAHHDHAWRRE